MPSPKGGGFPCADSGAGAGHMADCDVSFAVASSSEWVKGRNAEYLKRRKEEGMMNSAQDDHLTDREKTLVAMGAAMGAGCRTCADKLYGIAVSLKIPEAEMVMALNGGLEAKSQALRTMEAKVSALIRGTGAKGTSASEGCGKLLSLVRLASFVAANSAPDALREMREARGRGIVPEQIGVAVALAKMVRKNAAAFSDQEISENARGLQFVGEEMCCPLPPDRGNTSACSCG